MRSFVFAEVCLSMSFIFVFETNRKQTTCTNKFSMCLPRDQFLFSRSWEESFFWCHKTRNKRCMRCRAFFISRLKTSQAWFKQESKQRTGNKLRLCCFLSVRWSKSWNLRETDCVFEWKVFFSCVVGFFALAADPRVFALRRVGNLGLWIFTW